MRTIDACTQIALHNAWNVNRLMTYRRSRQLILHNPSRWNPDASKNLSLLLKKYDSILIAPKKYHIEEQAYALQNQESVHVLKQHCNFGPHIVTREPVHEPHILIHDVSEEFQENPSQKTMAIVGHPQPKNLEMCRNIYFNGIQYVDWNPQWLLAGVVSPMILTEKQYPNITSLNPLCI